METDERLEEIAMSIIANSGAARSSAFEALQAVKKGDRAAAQTLLTQADAQLQSAHEAHRELLKLDATGEVDKLTVLLAHAQDHLMTSALAKELIAEIVLLYEKIDKAEEV
ncbi:MAG: PTS lactose/cellobiose transporter subunit IIA [Oscillospiraceae bacterium]|nr:PTS lactose/cellobiose transporter subunit IIA [Oscillospiraceae bacterium]